MGLTIEYFPTATDQARNTVKGRGYAAYPSHFLAVSPGALLHGNSCQTSRSFANTSSPAPQPPTA